MRPDDLTLHARVAHEVRAHRRGLPPLVTSSFEHLVDSRQVSRAISQSLGDCHFEFFSSDQIELLEQARGRPAEVAP